MFGKKNKTISSVEDTRTKVNTIIGEGAVFDGNLRAPETIRIDGTINGNCTCEKKLILGSEGQITGNISAQDLIISGKVDGDISATGKLELLSTGKISGNIIAKSLVIDENARFDGRCTMTASLSESGEKPYLPDNTQTPSPAVIPEKSSYTESNNFQDKVSDNKTTQSTSSEDNSSESKPSENKTSERKYSANKYSESKFSPEDFAKPTYSDSSSRNSESTTRNTRAGSRSGNDSKKK